MVLIDTTCMRPGETAIEEMGAQADKAELRLRLTSMLRCAGLLTCAQAVPCSDQAMSLLRRLVLSESDNAPQP
jgi:hypothetical protein